MKPGVYADLSSTEYHEAEGIGCSALKRVLKSPAHFKGQVRKKGVHHFDQGTAIHTAILEPELFEETIHHSDARRGTKAWTAAEEEAGDRMLIKTDDYEMALAVRDAVHSVPSYSRILREGNAEREMSAFALDPETKELVRVRPDLVWREMNLMLDVKSTASASYDQFQRSVGNFGYHIQDAMYRHVWGLATEERIETFYFLAVEKEAPYCSALFELDDRAMDRGWELYREALEKYSKSKSDDIWPGYPVEPQVLSLKPWDLGPEQQSKPETGSLGYPLA